MQEAMRIHEEQISVFGPAIAGCHARVRCRVAPHSEPHAKGAHRGDREAE